MKILTILIASAGFVSAQLFYSDEDFYRYLENRQRMAIAEAQAQAWAREQAAAPKLIPIDEELAREVDEVLKQRVRDAIEWLRNHPEPRY